MRHNPYKQQGKYFILKRAKPHSRLKAGTGTHWIGFAFDRPAWGYVSVNVPHIPKFNLSAGVLNYKGKLCFRRPRIGRPGRKIDYDKVASIMDGR